MVKINGFEKMPYNNIIKAKDRVLLKSNNNTFAPLNQLKADVFERSTKNLDNSKKTVNFSGNDVITPLDIYDKEGNVIAKKFIKKDKSGEKTIGTFILNFDKNKKLLSSKGSVHGCSLSELINEAEKYVKMTKDGYYLA